jgi:quinol monooxygenase YgiN
VGAELDRHVHPAEAITADGLFMLEMGSGHGSMELHVFVQFRAKAGCERRVKKALLGVLEASRDEPGCRAIHAFRAVDDDRLFYVQSVWQDEASFTMHAELPHTVEFLDEVSALVDQPVQVIRTRLLA